MVTVKDGRFGMYLNWKKINAKMPAEYQESPSELPLGDAWALVEAKLSSAGKGGKGRGKKKTATAVAISNAVPLPPPPKRPLSAYLHFCAAKRSEVATTAKSLGDVSKELAKLWAATSDEKNGRIVYEDLAAAGKRAYETKKAAWLEECDSIRVEVGRGNIATKARSTKKASTSKVRASKRGVAKSPREPLSQPSPKKNLSGYLHFCAAKRPEVSKSVRTLGQISKELARLWAETAEDGGAARRPYEELAAADKERYRREVEEFGPTVNGTRRTGVPKRGTRTVGAPKSASASKERPKPPRAPSAYMLFCSARRKDVVNKDGTKPSFGDTTKILAEMWRSCSDEIRLSFQRQADLEKEKLLSEFVR